MAPQESGRFHPLVVIFDGLSTLPRIGMSQVPFGVDHDQDTLDSLRVTSSLQIGQILRRLSLCL